ncbi:ArsR family transcriptional regulator [Methanolobus vulcani]|uniref:ArsR family transcriptional regulator n=1 Tax=Methanolobus vulcani TaxID=38026 RepID=A0A7Z8KR90_9EURY|nr:ArsR family transcriptional regulator [Methanolobus vulcani]TQD29535.1 ArsR family transcriptional regulator [Methanolobus vulcani]
MTQNSTFSQVTTDQKLMILNALGSDTRIKIMQLIRENEIHISEIARNLGLSVPVISKHANILEDAGLITRKIYGKSHVICVNNTNIFSALDMFAPKKKVHVKKGTCLLEALENVAAVEVKKINGQESVVSTDGEEGFFVYEVDGEFSKKTVKDYKIEKNSTVSWKKLEPVARIELDIVVDGE